MLPLCALKTQSKMHTVSSADGQLKLIFFLRVKVKIAEKWGKNKVAPMEKT